MVEWPRFFQRANYSFDALARCVRHVLLTRTRPILAAGQQRIHSGFKVMEIFESSSICIEDDIPLGDKDRLNQIPPLVGKTFHLTGTGFTKTICDIVLSSIGWVCVSTKTGHSLTLRAYTPGGYGCLARPALLPNAVNLKEKRIRGQSGYSMSKCLSLVKLPPIKLSHC